jgi:FAD-dependent oxidoreductase domain-containing protein 1
MQRVVIVGGGAVGSSTAYHLAVHSRFRGSIVVVERDPTYRIASSSLSCSSIRQQFSTPVNIAMSQYGLGFLHRAAEALEVDGDKPQLALREPGYLFLASPSGIEVLCDNHRVQRAAGADVALLQPSELKTRFPWLSTDGIAAGSLGLSGEGWFDGPALLQALRRKARKLGVRYIAQDAVGFTRAGERVSGVRLADGTVLDCDVAVNAAGPWAARVAEWAGVVLPVRARKRMVYVVACRTPLPNCPLVIDATGIFFRPEGLGYVCGRSPGEGEPDPDEPPLEVDDAMFHDYVWPAMATRAPAFEELKMMSSWAGYYEYNVFDQNGIIGPHPAVPNLIFANGFSGHGIQHSPATGRGVAELIADGGYVSLDLSPLGFSRVVAGEKLIERNIV